MSFKEAATKKSLTIDHQKALFVSYFFHPHQNELLLSIETCHNRVHIFNNTHFNSTRYLIPMAKSERLNGLEWEQRASPVNILNQIKICHPHHLIEDSEQLPIPSEVDKCSL